MRSHASNAINGYGAYLQNERFPMTQAIAIGRALLQEAVSEEGKRVFGLGVGLVVLIIFGILCILICLLGSATRSPGGVFILSLILFVIFCAILFSLPRGDDDSRKDTSGIPEGRDKTRFWHIFLFILLAIGVILALLGMLVNHIKPTRYARPLSQRVDVMRYA
eukprot:jgi/Mesvir1/3984/Mv15040-RA.1